MTTQCMLISMAVLKFYPTPGRLHGVKDLYLALTLQFVNIIFY